MLKNPVTGEDHGVAIVLDEGFIWKQGDCGQGSFEVEAEGIHLSFENSNFILYDFDWSNHVLAARGARIEGHEGPRSRGG